MSRLVRLVFALLLAVSAATAQSIAIRNVTVIDVVEGRALPGVTVVIEGDKIASVSKDAKAPKGARVIDGIGKYLVPGLWDMHTHFTQDSASLDLFLANGITGVRDMGAIALRRDGNRVSNLPRDEAIQLLVRTRDDIRTGKLLGPRMYTVGMIVTGPNPNNPNATPAPHQIVVKTPEEARAAVNKLADMRVDAIKVHARLTRDCFLAIVDEAAKRKLRVTGHTPVALDPVEVANAGQSTIEHFTGVWEYAHKGGLKKGDPGIDVGYQTEIDAFKKNNVYIVPTLVNFQAPAEAHRIVNNNFEHEPLIDFVVPELALNWVREWSKTDFDAKTAKGFSDSVKTLQEMTVRFHKGGVAILAGTDASGIFTYPGFSLHEEMRLLNAGGLSPLDSLRSATIVPARYLGIEKETGSVSAGKSADLVLLRADPLADIRNTTAIDSVFVRGKLLDQKALKAMLDRVRERSKTSRTLLRTLKWGEG